MIHKGRGSGLSYCHRDTDDLIESGHEVRFRWKGVTCKKCSSFRRLKKPRDSVERDFWRSLHEKVVIAEKKRALKIALARVPIHGTHTHSRNEELKTFCGLPITAEMQIFKWPRFTCKDCRAVRKEFKKQDNVEEKESNFFNVPEGE